MLRSLPSAIDDAHDTLYEPNAVFSQFLASASMTFFSVFLSLLPLLVLSVLAVLILSFLSFPFSFFAFLSSLSFPLSSFLFYVSFFQLTCVCRAYTCVVIGTIVRAIYAWYSFLGGKRYNRFFQARVVRRMHRYGPGTS